MAKVTTVTEEGLKKLEEELLHLKNTRRKEVADALQYARSLGDLSENSEYDEAKNEQAKVEARITELEEILKHIQVVNENDVHTDSVNVGARVKVLAKFPDEDEEEEVEYTVVGSTEANPLENRISDQSPIGNALLGAVVGDVLKPEVPGGVIEIKVLEISK